MSYTKRTYLKSLLQAKVLGVNRPLSLSICLTNRCNLRCIYCYGDYSCRKDSDLSLSEIFYIIDEAHRLGTQHLYLTGGEPLLRADIGKIIERASQHGITTGMVSNGHLVPRRIDGLSGLGKLILSLDGRESANDANRGISTFRKVMAAIDSCVKHGLNFDLKMVLNRNSMAEVHWMLDLCEQLSVKLEVVFAYAPKSEFQHIQHAHLMLVGDERNKLAEELLQLKRAQRPLMFYSAVYENAAQWPQYHDEDMLHSIKNKHFPYIRCNAGRFHAFIDGDGLVYPCNQLISAFPAKHAVRDGFEEAWDNLSRTNTCRACNIPFLTHQNLVHQLFLSYLLRQWGWKMRGAKRP